MIWYIKYYFRLLIDTLVQFFTFPASQTHAILCPKKHFVRSRACIKQHMFEGKQTAVAVGMLKLALKLLLCDGCLSIREYYKSA